MPEPGTSESHWHLAHGTTNLDIGRITVDRPSRMRAEPTNANSGLESFVLAS